MVAEHMERSVKFGVVLFDGVCGLCDRFVRFVLAKDTAGALRFAPLSGKTAAAVLGRHPEISRDGQSIIFVRNFETAAESVDVRSEAVLEIGSVLGGGWRALSWLRIVPRIIRDGMYRCLARRRYGWFGRYDTCCLPDGPSFQDRFLP